VLLLATDPAVEADLVAFCQATGNALERQEAEGNRFRGWVRKKGG
jgi:TusA-related sulfurtransferase